MSSKSVVRSKLRKCQTQFNEAWERKLSAAVRRLNEKRNDLLLQLLDPTDNLYLLNKLKNIYFNLLLKSLREGNNNRQQSYKEKLKKVNDEIQSHSNQIDAG